MRTAEYKALDALCERQFNLMIPTTPTRETAKQVDRA